MTSSLVSVIVPAYNAERYLGFTLDSLVAQTYRNLEVIVMDDASTDDTVGVAARYGDPVRVIRQPTNRGIYENANAGIAEARGEYIAIYHGDDVYEPTIVEREVAAFQAHPELGAVFCLDRFIDAEGREYGRLVLPPEVAGGAPLEFGQVLNALLTHKNVFLRCPSAMVPASVYRDVGPYRQDRYRNTSDLDMWLLISRRYPILIMEEYLFRYRHFHGSSAQRYHYLRTRPENFFTIVDDHLGAGAREYAAPGALAAYEGHRAEDLLRVAAAEYITGNRAAARGTMGRVAWHAIRRSGLPRRHRLLAFAAVMNALTRVPRLAPLAAALRRQVYGARPRPATH